MAEVNYCMGRTLAKLQSFKKSVACFHEAIIVQRQTAGSDSKEVGDSKNARGVSQGKLGLYDEAQTSLSEARGIRKLLHDEAGIAETIKNIATVKSAQSR